MVSQDQLDAAAQRFAELETQITEAAGRGDFDAVANLARERSEMEPLITAYTEYKRLDGEIAYEYFPALRELADRRVGLLSGGEQQMLALAYALGRRPRLLLVDELSLGLAPVIVERMLPALRRYATETGASILLVEQHVELALEIADRAVALAHGEVVLERDARALRGDRDVLVASYLGTA